jgi:hypothetical protein
LHWAAGALAELGLVSAGLNGSTASVGILFACGAAFSLAGEADDAAFKKQVAPLLQHSCLECHAGEEPEADLDLSGFADGSRKLDEAGVWRRVRDQLRANKMPPKKKPRPAKAEVDGALAWIDAKLAELRAAHAIDPGTVTLRRLNRVEYQNTIRDLVGVDFDAQGLFPTDDVGYGFDNIGDVLSISDVLLEKYVSAAERIAREAIVVADPRHPPERVLTDSELDERGGVESRNGGWSLYSNGSIDATLEIERAGDYVFRARAWAQQAGPDPARIEFELDHKRVALLDVFAKQDVPELYEARVALAPGKHRLSAGFGNDFYDPKNPDKSQRDRNLFIEQISFAGPIGASVPSEFQQRFVAAHEGRSARELVEELATRAWRRPPAKEEVDRLLALAPKDSKRDQTLRAALEALLASPRFLFRTEADPPDAKAGSVRDLDDFELATRLSYFLWSSMPDDELFTLAASKKLRDDATLHAQVVRMLRDARASALTANFAGQWLQLRNLERASPDATRFPNFDDDLRAAMHAETAMLFEAVLRENRPLRELIDPDFTFVNERLARHYGIAGVTGPMMQRVPLDANLRRVRGGLIEQASMLVVTSNPTRTSPVKRGKWILENVLGTPPPPPLPGVDNLDESAKAAHAASLRERMAQHRSDPKCAVCHEHMDAFGFALEQFDPIGAWRDKADGFAIDPSGELGDGTPFDGAGELERLLADDPRVLRCLAKKLAVYAVGRGMREADEVAFDEMLEARTAANTTLADLIDAVVHMDAFRRRVVAKQP